ncbi:TonB-dependent receptor plug domain-containing protein [Paraflavitalea speifideaquila]|uniref:TonB-dependent receptor plug domain-containing protein n=1 Tax=Paraflavitalea speifideaquila TaxID=3076558 RepID=UPI0028E4CEF4|nr:TonB-dependent receptor plug domain-containing protein [Paraflavitalea speifideiaquila]
MRIILLLLITLLLPAIQTSAQKISLKAKNISLRNALTYISDSTGHAFTADPEYFRFCKPVSINADSIEYEQALEWCFKDQPLSFHIINGTIYIEIKDVKGRVTNMNNEPLEGITVTPEDITRSTVTNKNGEFTLYRCATQAFLVLTSVNMQCDTVPIAGQTSLKVTMKRKITESPNVTVVVSTGMEEIPKERATGSFFNIDNPQINQRVSTGILDRLEGQATGVLITRNRSKTANQPFFSIRGRTTIFSNTTPLIIVDNFPYGTDVNNINPNDIENISINKDAAATSIWGGAAGNGVMVINLKKGRYRQKPVISLSSNTMYTLKPNPWYFSQVSSDEYVDLERTLFNKGFYNSQLDAGYALISPVVDILDQQRKQQLTANAANAALDELKKQDVRNDYNKWFYQAALLQQYAWSLSGGTAHTHYFFSAGYDHQKLSQVKSRYNRLTINSRVTIKPLKHLEITTSITGIKTITRNNMPLPHILYPYSSLADPNGNYLTVPMDWRQSWKDKQQMGITNNWDYQPLEELDLLNHKMNVINLRFKFAANYKFGKGFDLGIAGQYQLENEQNTNEQDAQSYFVRNLSNIFTELSGNLPIYHIPQGNIADQLKHNYEALNARLQLNYNSTFNNNFELSSIAGIETRTEKTDTSISTLYGYRNGQWKNEQMDFKKPYPLFYKPMIQATIPENKYSSTFYDHYASLYANAALTYLKRYTFSASGRIDQSNLFGMGINKRGIPLWSAGVNWILSKEKFYHISWLSLLKWRVTFGCNGNVNRNATAYLTAYRNPAAGNALPSASILNPLTITCVGKRSIP